MLRNPKLIHQTVLYFCDIIVMALNCYRIISYGSDTWDDNIVNMWILGDAVKIIIFLEFGLDIKNMLRDMKELNNKMLKNMSSSTTEQFTQESLIK